MRLAITFVLLTGCAPTIASGPDDAGPRPDAASSDAFVSIDAFAPSDAFVSGDAFVGTDANDACIVDYNVGHCISTASCSAMSGYSSTAGRCPGAADIQCCSLTPNLSANPPIPAGYRLMMQSEVTAAMTTWAVMILHDGATYPMYAMVMMTFGTQPVLAIVEWHPPDFQNSVVHRGVTLFVPG